MHDTIPAWFAATAAAHPASSAPADHGIVFEERHWSFAAIARRAEGVAAWMRARGIGRGHVVAICLPTRMEIPFAHLAAQRLGAITLPLNTAYTADELAFILADAAARLLVTDRRGCDVLASIRAQLPALRDVVLVEDSEPPPTGTIPFPEPHPPASSSRSEEGITGPHPPAPSPWGEGESGRAGGQGRGSSPLLGRGVPRAAGRGEAGAESHPPALPPWGEGVKAEDIAMIMYTSGTTGRPKGAQITHRNITANLRAILETWRITAADRFLLTLPLFHAHGLVMGLHATIFSGCTTFLRARYDADEVLRELAQRRCTLFMGVPTHYFRFLKSPELDRVDLSAMRLFTSGSAPLDATTFAEFERRTGHPILERYGLTETLFNTGNPYDRALGPRLPGTVGLPFPGVQVSIHALQDGADGGTAGAELKQGEEGEIWVCGPNVFKGYLNRPEATAEAMQDGWFRTGDLGRLRQENGYLEILGRAKDLIITGGYNVYPAEVEAVLVALPGVDEAAVIGKPSPEYGETVHAVIAPKPGATLDPDALLAECGRHIAKYKVPRSVEIVPHLPRNAMGKVQKQVLREQSKPRA